MQNPESALSRIGPLAPALRTRAISSSTKQRAALGVRATVAHADVQHLVAVGACRDDRVITELAGVAVAGAALVVAVNFADEAVDIHDQPPAAGAGTELPRAAQRQAEDAVELADMPEREGPQERPERRRRHRAMTKDRLGVAGPQDVTVIDAVRTQQHRVHQRQHLAPRPRRARPTAKPDGRVDQRLKAQPAAEGDREHQARVNDDTLIIKRDIRSVRQTMHHAGDPLMQPRSRWHGPSCLHRVMSLPHPDRTTRRKRRIKAETSSAAWRGFRSAI